MAMALNHSNNGGLVTMVLPIIAFSYGMQATPRPPKDYWLILMSFQSAVIFVKFMLRIRIFCPDPTQYSYAVNDGLDLTTPGACPPRVNPLGGDYQPTFLETPYILGLMPGGSEEWFLWYIRWDLLVVALLYWRQLHLRRIGQWRNMHKGFISEISTLYGMTSMNEESVFDMAREAHDTYIMTRI